MARDINLLCGKSIKMNGLIGDFVQEAILEYSTAFTFDSALRNRYRASIVIYDVHRVIMNEGE